MSRFQIAMEAIVLVPILEVLLEHLVLSDIESLYGAFVLIDRFNAIAKTPTLTKIIEQKRWCCVCAASHEQCPPELRGCTSSYKHALDVLDDLSTFMTIRIKQHRTSTDTIAYARALAHPTCELVTPVSCGIPLRADEPTRPSGTHAVLMRGVFGCKPPHSTFYLIACVAERRIPKWFYDKYDDGESHWLEHVE